MVLDFIMIYIFATVVGRVGTALAVGSVVEVCNTTGNPRIVWILRLVKTQ